MQTSILALSALVSVAAAAGSDLTTFTITNTKEGHVYSKVITQAVSEVGHWYGEGENDAATTTAAAETTSAAEEKELAGSDLTTFTITNTKNGNVYSKTITQVVSDVGKWTERGVVHSEGEAAETTSAPAETTSAAEEEELAGSDLTTFTITNTKNGNVYSKTITQAVSDVGKWTERGVVHTEGESAASTSEESAPADVSTYEGKAGAAVVGSAGLGAAAIAAFLL